MMLKYSTKYLNKILSKDGGGLLVTDLVPEIGFFGTRKISKLYIISAPLPLKMPTRALR